MKTNLRLSKRWLVLENAANTLTIQHFNRNSSDKRNYELGFDLLSHLNKVKTNNELIEFIGRKEFYSTTFIYESPNLILLKSDIVRSVPLFYELNNETLSVSDQIYFKNTHQIDPGSVYEMVETNYVSGDKTLYKGIYGLQTAEIVIFKKSKIHKERYFKYDTKSAETKNKLNYKETGSSLDYLFKTIFNDIIESVGREGRIIVPLSGGHDSRIIVNYLYKLGFNNVICYSYGIPENIQSKKSKQVAETLGFEWHFIEYTADKWHRLHQNGEFDKYIEYACSGVSTPHLQDFLAVYELKKSNVVKSSDVFIPGHGLDILSNVIDHTKNKKNIVAAATKRYCRTEKLENNIVYNRYKKIFDNAAISEETFLDYLLWQERQAKFNINSLRVYEYFGFSTRIPFWDIRLVKFWLSIDRSIKYSRDFLFKIEQEKLLIRTLRNISYADNTNLNEKKDSRSWYKSFIPNYLKILFLRLTAKKVQQDEGLNLIYEKKANSVMNLIKPIKDWPVETIEVIEKDLHRYPFQINHHFLTRLYTVSKVLDNK